MLGTEDLSYAYAQIKINKVFLYSILFVAILRKEYINDIKNRYSCILGTGAGTHFRLDGDVRIGLQRAIDDLLEMNIDSLEYDEMLATSSTAGGLKMTVHGLVYDMTARAAKRHWEQGHYPLRYGRKASQNRLKIKSILI